MDLSVFLVLMTIVGVIELPTDIAAQSSVYETLVNIEAEGYRAEAHHVVTTDGYILEMHRIPFRRHQVEGLDNRPVVFVMHGLLAASNSFIVLGREYSIAYNLADAGFDVWMGNARGTRNSRFHVTKDPDNREDRLKFFDFTWEEIGMFDIAAMVDYVLEHTGKEQLHYIGHSQGGTAFLVLNTMRPEYNAKFASAHLLAGVGYQDYFPNILLRPLATFTNTIYRLTLRLGLVEVFPPRSSNATSGDYHISEYCFGDVNLKEMCQLTGIREIMGERIIDLPDLGELGTGGAALKQIAHYGQNVQDKVFRRWNYGSVQNLEVYGSTNPPIYDLSLITVNVTMHYTVSDNLLDERDVLAMARDMPNTVARKVTREGFLHADFVYANDARELVTEYIIEAIQNLEYPPEAEEVPDPDLTETDGSSTLVLSLIYKMFLVVYSIYYLVSS